MRSQRRLIGNDVVDLRDPEARIETLHPRFIARVFTAAEQRQINAASDPCRALWALWAGKEAGYKILKKLVPTTLFAHAAFRVQLRGDAGIRGRLEGVVRHQGLCFQLKLHSDAAKIHAVALSAVGNDSVTEPPRCRVGTGWSALEHSAAVRRLALRDLRAWFGDGAGDLRIVGSRPPRLVRAETALDADLSLSHHGSWVAWAAVY